MEVNPLYCQNFQILRSKIFPAKSPGNEMKIAGNGMAQQ
jgi:hypothetical protein